MLSRASVGGAAGARGVGLQDEVFAWVAVAMLAEQALPRPPLPGTLVRVGAQTGFEVDDVAVQSELGGYALCQVKGGLSLGTTTESPLAGALDQVVAQYLAGMPEGSGRRRPRPGLDAIVIVIDAAATRPVREHLAPAISRACSLPPGTPLASQLTADEEHALKVALGHLRRSWTARRGSPSEEDLRELLGVLRVVVLDTADGGPDRAAALAMLLGLVPAGREAEAWTALVAVGHAVSEAREWRDRRRLVADLARRGVAVGPGPTLARDIETLRAVSQSNLAALRPHVALPIAGGIHLARPADATLAEATHTDGGVLVVGDAGTGKTGLVVTLAAGRAAAGQEVVLLRAADVAAGAVGGGVTLSRPLDQVLLEWTGTDPATLVIDALDAARGSEDRARLAALVTALAGSRWQVVATVRTYDILYGPELRAAFAGPDLTSDPGWLDNRLRGVRHLRVDDLTDAELAPVTSRDTALAAFFSESAPAVQALLRNPFNLRLAAELLAQGASLTPAARARLSAARTRLDLLAAYWEQRVDGAEDGFARTDVLTRIAEEMLARRRLRVLAAPPAVHGSDDAAVTGLLSDNLLALEQQPGTRARRVVTFDHHILFDYTLMRCVLRDPLDPLRLLGRLDTDSALPLVARPSLDLLFDELWEEGGDRAGFWQLALGLAGSSHLLTSLAAAARLAAAGPDGAALGPLAAACTSADTSQRSAGYALLAQLVGVVRASVTPDAQVAAAAPGLASLAVSLARNAHQTTAQWDCLASTVDLLTALNRRRPFTSGQPDAAACAAAVVDLLDACRSDPGGFEQVAVAATRQIGAAVRIDQRHAGVVTRLLDDQTALSQWGGRVLAELVEAIPQVAPADPALALRLARTAWAFDEPREETVALVASPLLPLTETRRDQADMARWALGQAFPELCRTDLATAAQIFAEIANTGLVPARDASQDRLVWPLVVGEARGWLSHGHDLGFLGGYDAITTMAAALRDALAGTGWEGHEPGPVLEVLVAFLHSAPAWAAILADAPQVDGLAAAVLPALDTGSLLAHPDTHEPAGRLLAALASHADADQHARLEAVVLAAGSRAEAAGIRGDRVTDVLISCLDPARVTDEALKARLAALVSEGGPPPLTVTPPAEMLFDGRITLSDRLEASDAPVSAALRVAAEALADDLSRLADGPADERAAARERLPERFLAADAADAWAPPAPLAIRHDLVRAAAMLAGDDRVEPGATLGARVAAVLLEAATAAEAGSAQAGGDAWGAGVRDDAASGIVALLRRPSWRTSTQASQLRATLQALLADANPVVRMQAAKGLDALPDEPPDPPTEVSLIREHLLGEPHPLVLSALLRILLSVTNRAPQAVDALLEEFSAGPQGAFLIHQPDGNERDAQDGTSPSDAGWTGRDRTVELVAAMLVFLAVDAGTPFASSRLSAWFATPLASPDRTQTLLHYLRPFLNPAGGRGQHTAFGLLAEAADAAKATWQASTTDGPPAAGHDQDGQARARSAALVAHHLARQLSFASGAREERSGTTRQQPRGDPATFAALALPVLRVVGAIRHPQVTQPIVEILVHLSAVEPRTVLLALAEAVPERGRYVTDSIAAGVVVPYLTRLLAEHRDLVLGDGDGIAAFRHLLQAFAGAGHADALAMAYTFSDVFR